MTDTESRGLTRLVAKREISTRVRDRGFLISTGVMLVIVLAILAINGLFLNGDSKAKVGVVGSSSTLQPALERAAAAADVKLVLKTYPDEAAARAAVEDGAVSAAFVRPDRVVVEDELDGDTGTVVQSAYREVTSVQRITAAGLDPAEVSRALDVPALGVDALDPKEEDADARMGFAYAGVFLLYFQFLSYGMAVAMGVVEEKSSRVVEILLATLRPWQLLAGKVLGIGALGIAQFALLGGVGLAGALAFDVVDVPSGVAGVAGQVLIWFILGFAFYACAYAAAASLVSRQEDLGNVTTPMTIVLIGSFFAVFPVLDSPDSALATTLSLVPPFSAMVMPLRWASGEAALWQVGLSMLLMAAAVVLLVRLSGRIYSRAILRTGSRVSWKEALGR